MHTPLDDNNLPDLEILKENLSYLYNIKENVLSAHTITAGGICEALSKMCFGNEIGAEITENIDLYTAMYGSVLIETDADIDAKYIGSTIEEAEIRADGAVVSIEEAIKIWTAPLEKVFPTIVPAEGAVETVSSDIKCPLVAKESFAKPRVLIPVFPGTNCEYDTARAFEAAGAVADTFVIRNLSSQAIADSVRTLAEKADNAQIIMIPGGFSGGDEPDGSGKLIATVFRQAAVRESVMKMLKVRDGLMLGICNGFQALIKLGLVPFGEIRDMDADCPTLTFNTIGRHVSTMVDTRICSTLSPWLMGTEVGDIHSVAVSHGEGRFVANDDMLRMLLKNGQIATQYVDKNGKATMDMPANPNGSFWAIEGISSPDGRVLGKMAHSERATKYTYQNIPGDKDQALFASGVRYFA